MTDGTLRIITFDNKIIDSFDQFPDTQKYTSTSKDLIRYTTSSRVHVLHKTESSKTLDGMKYGSRNYLSIIFDILVKNNAFLNHNKFNINEKILSISS